MSSRPSLSLQGAGLAAMTPRGSMPEGSSLQVDDVERRLARHSKKPQQGSKNMNKSTGPQTARSLLEENQRLAAIKNENTKLERKASKDLVDEILDREKQDMEFQRKKEQKRREAHHALAQKYKAAIVQQELKKAQETSKKQASGPGEVFFPFTEGESVEKYRQAQNSQLRSEMQDHMKEQAARQPVRTDALMASVSHQYPRLYQQTVDSSGAQNETQRLDVAPHIGGRHPLFLSRNREHMSRRINDAHVTEAMNSKVEIFKSQLEQLAEERHREVREHEEGMMINDALRHDNALLKAAERQKVNQFLKAQIAEREAREEQEKKELRAQCCGYFGPEEKNLQAPEIHEDHCRQLISQMETDQHRRYDEVHRRLQEEKHIVNNTMKVMVDDRLKAVEKASKHKKILTKTWDNQKKIRAAQERVERII